MVKKLSQKAKDLCNLLINDSLLLETQIEELNIEILKYKDLEKELKIKEKQIKKYQEILNLLPGNDYQKNNPYVYSHTIIGEKYPFYIGYSSNSDNTYNRCREFYSRNYEWQKYVKDKGGTDKIKVKILAEIETEKEALELEKYYIKYYSKKLVNMKVLSDAKTDVNIEIDIPKQLHNMVIGTNLEYLAPYFMSGYIKMNMGVLKSFIKYSSPSAFYNWKKDYLLGVMERYGNLSCPLYSDRGIGIHNSKTFNESCLNDLFNYISENNRLDFREHVTDHFKEILGSAELRRKYRLSVKAETLDINGNERVKRDTVIRFLKKKGLL